MFRSLMVEVMWDYGVFRRLLEVVEIEGRFFVKGFTESGD